MLKKTNNLKGVSKYLGHSSTSTTANLYIHDELQLEDLFPENNWLNLIFDRVWFKKNRSECNFNNNYKILDNYIIDNNTDDKTKKLLDYIIGCFELMEEELRKENC